MTCSKLRRRHATALLTVLALVVPSSALVPPRTPGSALPADTATRIRDAREGALTPAHPLRGVVAANLSARRATGAPSLTTLSGTFQYPVLPMKFQDTGADPFTPTEIEDQLFQQGYNAGGRPGSLRDYFDEVSYGNYVVDGSVAAWATAAENESYYVGAADCGGLCTSTTTSAAGLVSEALAAHDAAIDFTLYDNDGPDGLANSGDDDGVVDLLVVVHAGTGGECGGGLWSHLDRYSGTFTSAYSTADTGESGQPILVEDFIVVPAKACDGTSLLTIGELAYLFGLHLGLPALWDRDQTSRGADAFALMARGAWGGNGSTPERPVHPSAYEKALLGWTVPELVTGSVPAASLPAASGTAHAREFRRAAACTQEEYVLVENRQKSGFDLDIPGDGLLIWHADDGVDAADDEARPRLRLLPGDGRFGTANDDAASAGDPWPGSANATSWDDASTPSSHRHGDRPSGASVTAISASGDPMTADLAQDGSPQLYFSDVVIGDNVGGDDDGVIDPFETITLGVALGNDGQADATGISATLALDSPVTGVTITNGAASYPDLVTCAAPSSADFEIQLDETVACETLLPFRLDVTSSEGSQSVRFELRVGTRLDVAALRVTSTSTDTGAPRITAQSGVAALVYHEQNAGRDEIRMTRVDDTGAALGTTTISDGTSGDARHPDVVWNGTEYGVVWEDDRDGTLEIYFARADASGVRIGASQRVTNDAGSATGPRLAWNGVDSGVYIAWQDDRNGDSDVLFAHLDSGGLKIGSDVALASGAAVQSAPDLAWNGARLGVVWQEDVAGEDSVFFVATDGDGSAAFANLRIESDAGDTGAPAIAPDDGQNAFGIVAIDHPASGTPRVRGWLQPEDGSAATGPKQLSSDATRFDALDLDADGTSFHAAWLEHRSGARRVVVLRADADLDPELDTPVTSSAAYGRTAAVAHAAGTLYAAWSAEDATSHRFDVWARPLLATGDCGRDDDGDGVNQPGDNCPNTPNPGQENGDTDSYGDACDCDDTNGDINPGATEVHCDGLDNDCDAGTVDAPDGDSDGVDICDVTDANNPDGVGVDCDDADPDNTPGATEICDGADNNCDGTADEGLAVSTWYQDADGDGYGDPNVSLDTCDGNQGAYIASAGDCDDTRDDVNPGALEVCGDGADTDCDGSVDEVTGPRYLGPSGSDTDNLCTDELAPCATFTHAIAVMCDAETVMVAEGEYTEDVVIGRPIRIDNAGSTLLTTLNGTGAGDIVQILASDVIWDGVNVKNSPGHACLRVGDATHTGLRGVSIRNAELSGCAQGLIFDSTGNTGSWNRALSLDIVGAVTDGTANTGIGVLVTGGNGRLELKSGLMRENDGPGIRVEAPPTGENTTIVIVGNRIRANGQDATADGAAGIDAAGTGDLRIEGNRIYDNVGPGAGDDGQGVLFDAVSGGNFFCNRMENNDTGARLVGGSDGLAFLHNRFSGQSGTGIFVESAAGATTTVSENLFTGNTTAIDNEGDGTFDARHNWWGAADGPSGAGGSGDAITGNIDTSAFIPTTAAPVLVKRPVDFGWPESNSPCYQTVQKGVDQANPMDLVLIGSGNYREHVTMNKQLTLEGISGGSGCSPSVIDGTQSGGSHLPALRIHDIASVAVRDLQIRGAGEGTTCGQNSGDEIGLDLENVDDSTFERLCIAENGVTELRVYGDSDNNTFRDLTIDGMLRLGDGSDQCGHRSREGVLVDGGPACEGGPGAMADNNRFENVEIAYAAHGMSIRLARNTEFDAGNVTASPAPAWFGGTDAVAIEIGPSEDTAITDSIVGSGEETNALRVGGKTAASCITEMSDALRTRIEGNDVNQSIEAGILLRHALDDVGAPKDTELRCNDVRQSGTGILTEYVGVAPENRLTLNDIRNNSTGVRNTDIRSLPAQENYWNASDGPSGSAPGSGDSVFGAVEFGPWLGNSSRIDNDGDTASECDGDCDDTNSAVWPGADEICDDIDNDCDGSIDEGLTLNTYYRDADEDGFGDAAATIEDCSATPPAGYVTDSSDCDDTLGSVYPGATEVSCDGIDQACDGSANEAPDGDSDGFDVCSPSDPYDGDGLEADCDDGASAVNPNGTETACDGIDQDCSGADLTPDADEDGADTCSSSDPNNPDGLEADCDDADPTRAPHLAEACDLIDNDCDGSVDEDLPQNTYYRDADGDGHGDAADSVDDCSATPPSGYVAAAGDCDDTRGDRYPGAALVCYDGIDHDCDGTIDAEQATCTALVATNLAFSSGSKEELTWTGGSGANAHALYRGHVPAAGLTALDHECLASELSTPSARDVDAPLPGEAYYYLATGLDTNGGGFVPSSLGSSSAGQARGDSLTQPSGPRVYVDPDATGSGSGLSWADAYTSVSTALAHGKAPGRGLELWTKGSHDSVQATLPATRPGVRLFGGFAGTETALHERMPSSTPTTLRGGGAGTVIDAGDRALHLIDVHVENAAVGVRIGDSASARFVGVQFATQSDRALDVDSARAGGTQLELLGSTFDGSGARGLSAVVRGGRLSGRVLDNSFAGNSDAALVLEARPGAANAELTLEILSNSVNGGARGIVVGAHLGDTELTGTSVPVISSNLIADTTGDAVVVEASGTWDTASGAAEARSAPWLIGNTITDAGGRGLLVEVARNDTSADPSLHAVQATPQVFENLLTFGSGYGVEESADDPGQALVADPTFVGNLLFGNAQLYRDEGGAGLTTLAELNALAEARANIEGDPLYVDRPANNHRLSAGSPALDQAQPDTPKRPNIDRDGLARVKDGDGDGDAKADIGAYER